MQCGFDDINPRVCCPIRRTSFPNDESSSVNTLEPNPNSERPNRNENTNDQYDFSNNPLLSTDCGKDLSQRIYGGEITDLDEFPWMVLLEYLTCTK